MFAASLCVFGTGRLVRRVGIGYWDWIRSKLSAPYYLLKAPLNSAMFIVVGFVVVRISYYDCPETSNFELSPNEHLPMLAILLAALTFVVGFRISSLSGRAQTEERLAIEVFRKLEQLIRRGLANSQLRQHILTIDGQVSSETRKNSYQTLRDGIFQARNRVTGLVRPQNVNYGQLIDQLEIDLDLWVRSKQTSIYWPEATLAILLVIVVTILAFFSPPLGSSDWHLALADTFGVISFTISFLLIYGFAYLEERRYRSNLEGSEAGKEFLVHFEDSLNQTKAGLISLVIVLLSVIFLFVYRTLLAPSFERLCQTC